MYRQPVEFIDLTYTYIEFMDLIYIYIIPNDHLLVVHTYIYIHTLWLFNVAMGSHHFQQVNHH